MDANLGLLLIPILGSILVVAFFSSSEAALISVNKFRIRHLAEQGNAGAKTVNRMIERHERFFATILLTETPSSSWPPCWPSASPASCSETAA